MENKEQFYRDIKAFVWVTLLYAPIILLFAKNDFGSVVTPTTQKLTLDLRTFEPTPQEEVTQSPQPPEPQEVVEKPIPLPTPKTVAEKPIPKDNNTTEKQKEKNFPVKQKKRNISSKPKIKTPPSKQKDGNAPSKKKEGSASSGQKNQFLSTLKRKINQGKSYPPIAQRMGMSGSVVVSFTVSRSGQPTNIQTSGPKVFHTSAKNAVLGAFPLPTDGVKLPIEITFTLTYTIVN